MSDATRPAKVLIIGSGPIVIGQAAEFDYAGTQACRALREEGIVSILVNSNPATIMTDEEIADIVYIEPLTVEVIGRIIEHERPDGLLPTLGGQTGLNLAVALADAGILDRYNVRLLGTPLDTIRKAEDRELFKELLISIGEPVPPSHVVNSMGEAREALRDIGLPAVIRPAYTLGGTGGGFANTMEEFELICAGGLAASPIHQVLLEQSLLGWKELEYEVMRDGANNCVTICNMENLDPMGVHTGDSIVVAPSQTLSDRDHQMLRSAALKIIRALGIEGGCNVQFALAPRPDVVEWPGHESANALPYYVIEVNPRVSRSSALASKATGYPIARVATKIAIGKTLDQIPNAVTARTTAAFEPALDYVVVKIPRWPFDKFATGDRHLGTQMKATGEVMAIDRTFEAALQKAIRSLEFGGRSLLWEDPSWGSDPALYDLEPTDQRLWLLMASLRHGWSVMQLAERTGIDPWFLHALERIIAGEKRLLEGPLSHERLRDAKRMGFSDEQIATLADSLPEQVRQLRHQWGIRPVYKMVDTCAAEFEAVTPYFYSTYEQENEALPLEGERALVVGSGPIRIGQGIEFDYCAVHAAMALRQAGVIAIMANSNPETVSTDFDISDRLYFEPLDEESIRDIIENEAGGPLYALAETGVAPIAEEAPFAPPATVLQFGGQTSLNLAVPLQKAMLPVSGTPSDAIDIAEDRRRFENFLQGLGIPQPPGAAIHTIEEALRTAQVIEYPVLVRPSYVLGGRAMEIVQNATELVRYMSAAVELANGKPVLIDKYLEGREVEVDAIADGEAVLIPGIMQHVERAGVHSGDSMAVYPGIDLTSAEIDVIVDFTTRIGLNLGVRGLMNIQYVIMPGREGGSDIFVIEVNPRSSRTVPFLSKVTGVPMVRLAVNIAQGRTLRDQGYEGGLVPAQPLVAVKAPVFSMSKLSGVDTYLGPEMKSTGEVMGIDENFHSAVAKALTAADLMLPSRGGILLSIADHTKAEAMPLVKKLHSIGYLLYATEGTANMIRALDIPVERVARRIGEGHPNSLDLIREGVVNGVLNIAEGTRTGTLRDGFEIRRAAAEKRIPCFTSTDTARAVIDSLLRGEETFSVRPFPQYRRP